MFLSHNTHTHTHTHIYITEAPSILEQFQFSSQYLKNDNILTISNGRNIPANSLDSSGLAHSSPSISCTLSNP